jgi:hypothetical protein
MSNVAELRALAKGLNIKGYSTAKKADLITLLEAHAQKTMPTDSTPKSEPTKVDVAPVQAKAPSKPKEEVAVQVAEVKSSQPMSEDLKKARSQSSWSTFLKEYKREHNCTLKEAMSKKEEYAQYKAKKN